MKVVEVFPGAAASPNAQYVVIQMHQAGQNQVGGHGITVYDAAGNAIGAEIFPGGVGNGAIQSKILIATSQAGTFFSLMPDLVLDVPIPLSGGKVCFDASPEDCLAWGDYSGSSAGVGTPFLQATGLVLGRAAIRRLDIVAPNNTLQAGDDTDQCSTDFVDGVPAPRNNAGVAGTIPPSVCGNGVLEGLEQCEAGVGCSSSCTLDAGALFFNGFE